MSSRFSGSPGDHITTLRLITIFLALTFIVAVKLTTDLGESFFNEPLPNAKKSYDKESFSGLFGLRNTVKEWPRLEDEDEPLGEYSQES